MVLLAGAAVRRNQRSAENADRVLDKVLHQGLGRSYGDDVQSPGKGYPGGQSGQGMGQGNACSKVLHRVTLWCL